MDALTAIPGPPADAGALGEKFGRSSSDRQASIRYAGPITTRGLRHSLVLGIAALVYGSLFAGIAHAEPTAQAPREVVGRPTFADYDEVLDDAVEAFDEQDYARARVLFERALAIRPNARVLRGLGIAALHLKRFTASKLELTAALADSRQPLTASQREGVEDLLSWMQSHLGTVKLQLHPAKAHVTLDESPMPAAELVMEPGVHRLQVSADGFEPHEHSIRIEAGEARTMSVSLLPRPPEPRVIPVEVVTPERTQPSATEPSPAWQRTMAPATPSDRDDSSSSLLDRWWFWTAVGVVVAGGVATTVVLTRESTPSFEKGGLGGVIMPLGHVP